MAALGSAMQKENIDGDIKDIMYQNEKLLPKLDEIVGPENYIESENTSGPKEGERFCGVPDEVEEMDRWTDFDDSTDEEEDYSEEPPYWWVGVTNMRQIPPSGLQVGVDGGTPVWVARVSLLPEIDQLGKIHKDKVYYLRNGKEVQKLDEIGGGWSGVEVLCVNKKAKVEWVKHEASWGVLMMAIEGTVQFGIGEVGRLNKANGPCAPGMVLDGVISVPWGGKEYSSKEFERLQVTWPVYYGEYNVRGKQNAKAKAVSWLAVEHIKTTKVTGEKKLAIPDRALKVGVEEGCAVYVARANNWIGKILDNGKLFLSDTGRFVYEDLLLHTTQGKGPEILCVHPKAKVEWISSNAGEHADDPYAITEKCGDAWIGRMETSEGSFVPGMVKEGTIHVSKKMPDGGMMDNPGKKYQLLMASL